MIFRIFSFVLASASPLLGQGYLPEDDASWSTVMPSEAGADSALLAEAEAYAADSGSDALVILKGGRIVSERYWNVSTRDTRMSLFSALKPLVASVVGRLLAAGAFNSLDQAASDFLTEWQGLPEKESITLRQHLSMTTGLEGGEQNLLRSLLARSECFFAANLPLAHEPGTFWTYNNPAYRLLFPIIEEARGRDLPEVFAERLFDPIGMSAANWVGRNYDLLAADELRTYSLDSVTGEPIGGDGLPRAVDQTINPPVRFFRLRVTR